MLNSISKKLKIESNQIKSYTILKKSLDARKKNDSWAGKEERAAKKRIAILFVIMDDARAGFRYAHR